MGGRRKQRRSRREGEIIQEGCRGLKEMNSLISFHPGFTESVRTLTRCPRAAARWFLPHDDVIIY